MKFGYGRIMLVAGLAAGTCAYATPIRIEAEASIPADDHNAVAVENANASGGSYVEMKSGNLLFTADIAEEGYYTLFVNYLLPSDRGNKTQNLTVNGASSGQIAFNPTDEFKTIKGANKIKLTKGKNEIGIVNSWGWVDVDYIELSPFEDTPWNISASLVTPEPTESAKKLFGFLLENFGKRTISGVMTNRVMENDGKNTPQTYETQEELAYIKNASGKNVALVGFDFIHATGTNSDQLWHQGYIHASLEMAKTVWKAGGIPQFNWHWKDPMKEVEAFYTESSKNTPFTDFHIGLAYDTATDTWKTESDEYKALVHDMESVADSLLALQEAGVALLWRPLHEASGKWFWWGTDGAKPCVALYKLMFDIFVNQKGLKNLIWVWTTDEAGDALDWYPGDEYVDVVGRDYYYYPREANHASLVSSFEKLKEMYGARKIVTLSENGSVPFPDSMKADGANWSWFMPWYGDYAMEGWANDNTADTWNTVMNNEYTITLEDMPGWDNYTAPEITTALMPATRAAAGMALRGRSLELQDISGNSLLQVFDMQGNLVLARTVTAGTRVELAGIPAGTYTVRLKSGADSSMRQIRLR